VEVAREQQVRIGDDDGVRGCFGMRRIEMDQRRRM
jgi:hypothetical protein